MQLHSVQPLRFFSDLSAGSLVPSRCNYIPYRSVPSTALRSTQSLRLHYVPLSPFDCTTFRSGSFVLTGRITKYCSSSGPLISELQHTDYPSNYKDQQAYVDDSMLNDADPGVPAGLDCIRKQEAGGQDRDQNPWLPEVG